MIQTPDHAAEYMPTDRRETFNHLLDDIYLLPPKEKGGVPEKKWEYHGSGKNMLV